jgi:hypothetical protein
MGIVSSELMAPNNFPAEQNCDGDASHLVTNPEEAVSKGSRLAKNDVFLAEVVRLEDRKASLVAAMSVHAQGQTKDT